MPERRLAAQHWNAVERYMRTGERHDYTRTSDGKRVRGLDYFEGKQINGVELETNPGEIEDMYLRGDLDQTIYQTT
jgi:hypothetical protein